MTKICRYLFKAPAQNQIIVDDTNNGYDGSLVRISAVDDSYPEWYYDSALNKGAYRVGARNAIKMPTTLVDTLITLNALTISFWIHPASTELLTKNVYNILGGYGLGGKCGISLTLYRYPAENYPSIPHSLYCDMQLSTRTTLVSSHDTLFNDSSWFFITCGYDKNAGIIRLTVDDKTFKQNIPTTSVLAWSGNLFQLGFNPYASSWTGFACAITDFTVHDTLLTTEEINIERQTTATPLIKISSISANRISNKTGKDMSVVSFTANQPLQEWVARAGGFSPTTGSLVGQSAMGGMLSAPLIFARTLFGKYLFASKVNLGAKIILPQGDVAEFIIDNEELFNGDGDYRINIYGKNSAGVWTPYE